jgi:hypothetical protein
LPGCDAPAMKIKFQADEDLDVLTVRGLGVPGPNIDIRTAAAAEIAGLKDPDAVRNKIWWATLVGSWWARRPEHQAKRTNIGNVNG